MSVNNLDLGNVDHDDALPFVSMLKIIILISLLINLMLLHFK